MKPCRVALAAAGLAVSALWAVAEIAPTTFEAHVAPGEPVACPVQVSVPAVPPRVDVVFAFDLTGSMSGTINAAKTRAIDVMGTLITNNPGVSFRFGVMSYMDYAASYNSYGYSDTYGSAAFGDYPYMLKQGLTSDTAAISEVITHLALGSGWDGPQDYTRIFYESYADTNVGWRDGAKRILLNFGDNVPHDNNLREGVTGTTGTWSTGGDPGRDGVMFTEDDLDLQAVLAGMDDHGVVLLEAHPNNSISSYWPYWQYWTGLTDGSFFVFSLSGDGTDFVNAVTGAIMAELLAPTVEDLRLVAQAGFESWVEAPGAYSGDTGVTVPFDLTLTAPTGTPAGDYTFVVGARDADGVGYGDLAVTLHVNATPVADAGPDQTVEQAGPAGTDVTLDGSASTDPDGAADIVSYDWYENGTLLGSGASMSRTFSAGTHAVTLIVTDSKGVADGDEVTVVVRDTTPPAVTCATAIGTLWPPDHKMVDVGLTLTASDVADASLQVVVTVTSDEATTAPGTGGEVHAPDAVVTDRGDGTFSVLLRAERAGMGDGRVYVITVTATDDAGLSRSASCAVTVDANAGKKGAAVDSGQAYDATQAN